jgi:hypothetical protein
VNGGLSIFYLWPESFEARGAYARRVSYKSVVWLALGVLCLVPAAAAAAPTIQVAINAAAEDVVIEPGDHATIGLNVTVEFKDITCTSGTKVGVDLVPPVAPPDWFGADPHPDADTYTYPKQTRPASLSIHVSEDAPPGSKGMYRLQPVLHFPNPAECGGVQPQADTPEFAIQVRTPGSPTSPSGDSSPTQNDGDDSPGLGLTSLVLVLVGVGLLRRRRQ